MQAERVVVAGVAVSELEPDRAGWRLEVQERGTDPAAVFAACGERQAALVARLRELGGLAELTTSLVELGEDHHYEGPMRYLASAAMWVELDPARSGELLAVAAAAGVDEVRGPRLSAAAAAGAGRELLAEAVADARARAVRLASAAGRRLGRAVAIEELPMSQYGDDGDDAVVAVAASARMPSGPSWDLGTRTLHVAVRVRVAYELT